MPTPKQMQINTLQSIGGVLYVTIFLFAVAYLIYSVVTEIRDWRIRKKLKEYYRQNPIEWILDFEDYLSERKQ